MALWSNWHDARLLTCVIDGSNPSRAAIIIYVIKMKDEVKKIARLELDDMKEDDILEWASILEEVEEVLDEERKGSLRDDKSKKDNSEFPFSKELLRLTDE